MKNRELVNIAGDEYSLPLGISKEYISKLEEAVQTGDTNYCGVMACSILLSVPFTFAQRLMEKMGRKKHQASLENQILNAIKFDRELREVNTSAKTVRTLERELDTGKDYLVFVNNHVLSVVKGEVQDHSKGSLRRIRFVYEVI